MELTAATQTTESTNTSDKLPTDKRTINVNTTTSTTNAEANTDGADSVSRTSTSSHHRPSAAVGVGGRVIKIKRRKLPVNKDIVDADTSSEIHQKPVSEPDSVPESQVETTQLPM